MSLSVQRLRNVFLAGKDLPRSETVYAGLETSVHKAGVDKLGRTLDAVLDPADPSVWVVRRLRVSFAISEPRHGEEAWARGVAEGIRQLIERGPDGQNAVRFPDRAAYWAWFLRDLISGGAASWWYQSLDSLRTLEFGAACVTLLSRQPELTAAILLQLDEWGVWEQAAPRIAESHAAQLLEWLAPTQDTPKQSLLEVAVAAWIETGSEPLESARARCNLAIALLRAFPADVASQIRGAVEILTHVGNALAALTPAQLDQLAESAGLGVIALDAFDEPVSTHLYLPIRLFPTALLDPVARALQARHEPNVQSSRTELTEFGGWFLLLPFYVSLQVDALVEEQHRPALRWLLARMCLGPRGRMSDENDPSLLWASGLERAPRLENLPWPDPVRLAAWQAEHNFDRESIPNYFGAEPWEAAWEPVATALVRTFAARLPGFRQASPAHLETNLFDGRSALRFSPGSVEVWLARRPLDILLRLGGFDAESYSLPWKDYATISIHLD